MEKSIPGSSVISPSKTRLGVQFGHASLWEGTLGKIMRFPNLGTRLIHT